MKILINGIPMDHPAVAGNITYEEVCGLARRAVERAPGVTWCLPDGRGGSLRRGQSAELIAGIQFDVTVTGNA